MTDDATRDIGWIKYISKSGTTTIQTASGKIFHCGVLSPEYNFVNGQIVHFVADEQNGFASYVTPHTVRHPTT